MSALENGRSDLMACPMTLTRRHLSFAFVFNSVLLGLVVAGFGARALFLPEYWPPVRITLLIHIAVTGGWFVLVVFQAGLVARGNIALHMRLGQLGAALAALVLVTGTVMIVELNLRHFSWLQVASNAVNMVTFAILFTAAMLCRRNRNAHMRLITFASLALMTPAIARLLQTLGLEFLTHPVWLSLCLVLPLYDWRVMRAILWPTWLGLGVSVAGLAGFASVAVLTAGSAAAQGADLNDGYEGRIRLVRFLDEPDGYCVDVPGGRDRVMLSMPAIAHTCHFDPLPDQVFRLDGAAILWPYGADPVCLSAVSATQGASFGFEPCQSMARQSFEFARNGEIRLAGTSLCLSVERTGPRFGEDPGPDQDAHGRGRPVNPQFSHLARALLLEDCGMGDPSFQRWTAYPE